MTTQLTAIILAAGASTRMGIDKPLLRFPSGKSLLEDQVERLAAAGIKNIYVVIGHHADQIKSALTNLNVKWIENRSWQSGSFSSLQTGIKNIPDIESGVLVLPIDAAGISPSTIKDTASKGLTTKKPVVSLYDKQKGHPVYLEKKICLTILTAKSDTRLDLILEDEKDLLTLQTSDANVLKNINTPEEWKQFIRVNR